MPQHCIQSPQHSTHRMGNINITLSLQNLDIDECLRNPCYANATYNTTAVSYMCACDPDYVCVTIEGTLF